MTVLLETAVESSPYAFSLGTVGVIGFIAATAIGTIACYNSNRPTGMEGKERPDIVHEVEK